ncbi:MAG: hypothetical protein ACREGR_02050 [Minisyncoccia bacterium]
MSRDEIMRRVQAGLLTITQAMELIHQQEDAVKIQQPPPEEKPAPVLETAPTGPYDHTKDQSRIQPQFAVAEKSGWCSVYFHGLRRPVTLPAELWEELLEECNATRLRDFLKENRTSFRSKKRCLAPTS